MSVSTVERYSGLPDRARHFALPRHFVEEGIVRYSFDGLSYESVLETLRAAGGVPRRMVMAHLGSGASLVAVLDGRSIDTTMGLTPTGGVRYSREHLQDQPEIRDWSWTTSVGLGGRSQ